jgi:hypothetical protein
MNNQFSKEMTDKINQEEPPIFKSWSRWYWLVLGALLVQIILYYVITMAFA